MNVVLRDLDVHFQGQQFSCYSFSIKNTRAADVPGRFASTPMDPAMELLLFYIPTVYRNTHDTDQNYRSTS